MKGEINSKIYIFDAVNNDGMFNIRSGSKRINKYADSVHIEPEFSGKFQKFRDNREEH